MNRTLLYILLLALFCPLGLTAQETTVFTDAQRSFKRGADFYEQGLFGKAQREFRQLLQLVQPSNEPEYEALRTQARLYYAKSAVRLGLPDGEKLMLDFIREHAPDPVSNQALIELADYYYNNKEYEKAVDYFNQIPSYNLTKDQRAEVKFKTGYAHFVQKQFDQAKSSFKAIEDIQNDYYFATHYYLGLIYFFEGNYDQAVEDLTIAGRSQRYDDYIPYYLAQIYFAQAKYDEVIRYVEPQLAQSSQRRTKELNQLIGQAYFEKGDYAKALPYLEYYAENTGTLREEEFYQLGYAQYKTGNYQKAIRNFEQLTGVDSEIGQTASYILGDLYLKSGDRNSARNAFSAAGRMNYDPTIREEALWNYAKLSYELKYDQEALTALEVIPPGSKYYNESQNLLAKVLLNTRDYERAMETIRNIPNQTPQLREAYQQLAYSQGLQLLQQGNIERAQALFDESLKVPIDPTLKALAIYWKGEIAHRQQRYNESIQLTNQFLTLASALRDLPDDASIHTANYRQGYNYLKQEDYTTALTYFGATVDGIQRNEAFIRNEVIKNQVLGDATLRAGDALFKRNRYNEAVGFYDEAINRRYSGYVYALYQKAIIEGLRGNETDKLIALEQIVEQYPRSEYADNALIQMGFVYQQNGQLGQAAQAYRKIVNDYPSSELINDALLRLGLVSYNQGDLNQAIAYYKQIFQNNPEAEERRAALLALEEIYVNDLGEPQKYFDFLETLPGYNVAGNTRDSISFRSAEVQYENGNYERAVQAFTNYLATYPNGQYSLLGYYRRGDSYAALRQYTEALRDYETVIARGNSRYYAKALEKAALIAYNYQLDFAKAYQLYTQLESVAPDNTMRFEAQLGALRASYRMNNVQAVYSTSQKVINNPAASQQQRATAYFYQGKMAYDQKDYDNAMDAFAQVIATSDNEQTAEARYLTAYIHYLRRNLDVAQQMAIDANRESSSYPYWVAKSVILLSDVFREKGDLLNARAALEALLENYEGDQDLVNEARAKLEVVNQQIQAGSRLNRNSTNPNNLLEMDEGN